MVVFVSIFLGLIAGPQSVEVAVYREDLEDYPHNGWSMFGLAQSLESQEKTEA